MRDVRERGLDVVLVEHRERSQAQVDTLAQLIETVEHYIGKGIPVQTSRITQVTIAADEPQTSIAFDRDAFDASYHQEISPLQFGAYPDDDFLLLTIADPEGHPWSGGPTRFGLLVDDLDTAHARALATGAVEIEPPVDTSWKPRSSTVMDPGGDHVDLYQGWSGRPAGAVSARAVFLVAEVCRRMTFSEDRREALDAGSPAPWRSIDRDGRKAAHARSRRSHDPTPPPFRVPSGGP